MKNLKSGEPGFERAIEKFINDGPKSGYNQLQTIEGDEVENITKGGVSSHPLRGTVGGVGQSWTSDGYLSHSGLSPLDLVLIGTVVSTVPVVVFEQLYRAFDVLAAPVDLLNIVQRLQDPDADKVDLFDDLVRYNQTNNVVHGKLLERVQYRLYDVTGFESSEFTNHGGRQYLTFMVSKDRLSIKHEGGEFVLYDGYSAHTKVASCVNIDEVKDMICTHVYGF